MTTTTERTKPLYQHIAGTMQAIRNCRAAGNHEWLERHEARIKEYIDGLPSGSGIDCGTVIDRDRTTGERIILLVSYHHMNDVGMYDGWTEHEIIITPSFDGINMRITGKDRNQIKDHLHEVYHYALTREIV